MLFDCFHSKRTISEVQLMHNVQEHKQVGERQNWLQEKLKDIVVTNAKLEHGQARNMENLFPSHVPSLDVENLNPTHQYSLTKNKP